MAELPQWLAEGLARQRPEPAAQRCDAGIPTVRPEGDMHPYLRAIVEGEAESVRAAGTGHRNDALNRAAWTLGRFVGGGELSEAYARGVLERAVAGHIGVDRFTAAEAYRTIQSGMAAGQHMSRRLDAN